MVLASVIRTSGKWGDDITHTRSRMALIVVNAFAGVSALIGMVMLLADWPVHFPSVWLQRAPFRDYTVPGLILGMVVGGSALLAMGALIRHARNAPLISLVAGEIMIGWLIGEMLLLPHNLFTDFGTYWAQAEYLLVGVATVALALRISPGGWRGMIPPLPPPDSPKEFLMYPTTGNDTHTVLEPGDHAEPPVITASQLTGLPDVVQRYLRYTQIIGKVPIRTARLRQQGAMRLKRGGRWLPMRAEQAYTTDPPAFSWHGTIRILPFVSVSGTDVLRDGHGQFRIALFGRIPLVSDHSPEVAQADLLRYLAEIVWFPTAWLDDCLTWEAIDDRSARATLRYRDLAVSAVMQFNACDELTQVSAIRAMHEGKGNVQTPWGGHNRAYREMHGMMIPTQCEVAWQPASGEFSYFRAALTDIAYDTPLPS